MVGGGGRHFALKYATASVGHVYILIEMPVQSFCHNYLTFEYFLSNQAFAYFISCKVN